MELSTLVYKKLNGTLSEEEAVHFSQWLNECEENELVFARLQYMKSKGAELPDFSSLDIEKAWLTTMASQKIKKEHNQSKVLRNTLKYAGIAVCLTIATYAAWVNYQPIDTPLIDPNAITLTLGNGEVKKIHQNSAVELIKDEDGAILGKNQEGQIDYSANEITDKLIFNTLNIPNGTRFKVLLSDGSLVHLNAGSSLKYPVKFMANQPRQVYLEGEAYFDVSTDKLNPFVVNSSNLAVEVLGTQFNMTAYAEDLEIRTVLVEGSVRLTDKNNTATSVHQTVLKPGEKGAMQLSSGKINVEPVDTSIYTGWRDGKLVLRKMRFKDIAKRLERHYNIKINNGFKALDERIFTGTFDIEGINEVLDTFAEEAQFEYTINGDEVDIYSPTL